MKLLEKTIPVVVTFLLVFFLMPYKVLAAKDMGQGDMVKLTGDVYVNEGTVINGDVVSINGNIFINGEVTGDAVSIFGDIIINGKVEGDAISIFGSITVGDRGKVMGDTVEALGGMLQNIKLKDLNISMPSIQINRWFNPFISLMFTTGLLVLLSLCYIIAPNKIKKMSEELENDIGKKIGTGFLVLILLPVTGVLLSILLAVTIIGTILIPFLWIALAGALLISQTSVYIYIGRIISTAVSRQRIHSYAALVIGLYSIWLIKIFFTFGGPMVVWINWLINIMIVMAGVGILTKQILTRKVKQ